jgi:hypothetical protein
MVGTAAIIAAFIDMASKASIHFSRASMIIENQCRNAAASVEDSLPC